LNIEGAWLQFRGKIYLSENTCCCATHRIKYYESSVFQSSNPGTSEIKILNLTEKALLFPHFLIYVIHFFQPAFNLKFDKFYIHVWVNEERLLPSILWE
jgi:hypothetical protein